MKVYNKDGKEIYLNSYDELKGEITFYMPGKIGYNQVSGSIYLGLLTGIKYFSVSGVIVRYENNNISSSSSEMADIKLHLNNGVLTFSCKHTKKLNEWHAVIIELRCNVT